MQKGAANTVLETADSHGGLEMTNEDLRTVNREQAEDALQRERDFAESLIATAQAIVLVLDTRGRIVRFNPYMEEISGYRLEEVQGRDWFTTFLPGRDQSRARELFVKAVGDIRTRGNVNPIVTKDGREREIEWYDKTLRDSDGTVVGLLAIGQDITERRRAEDALLASEEKYRVLFETAKDAIFLSDETGRFVDVNQEACESLGYSREELLKLSNREIDAGPTGYKAFQQVRNGPAKEAIFEVNQRRKDGTLLPVEITGKFFESDGKQIALAIARDITERKAAEDALRDREAQYRSIFNSTTDAFLIFDTDGNIVEVNPQACKIYGYPHKELIKLSGKDIVHPDHYHLFEQFRRDVQTADEFHAESVDVHKDGTTFDVKVSGTEFDYKGKPHLLAVIRDITERKAAEEALRESEEFSFSLLNNSPNPILVINPDTSVRYVNPALERLTGFSSAEIIGMKAPYPWWTEETLQKTGIDLGDAMRKGATNLEELFQTRNGERFWVEITSAPVRSNGEFKYYLANWIDITERKRAEDALRIERDNLVNILESMEDGVYIVNQQYDIQYVNSALKKDFGSVEGRKCYEYFHDRKEVCPWCKNQEVFAGKTVRWEWYSFKNQRTYDLIDTLLKNPDGSISKLEIFRDITERKRMEEALERSEAFLNVTGRMAKVGGWELDAETRDVRWTDETYRIHEVPLDCKPPLDEAINFYHPEDRPKLEHAIQRALEHGEPYDMELRFITARGKHLWVHTICKPHIVDGKTGKLTGTFQDITERKAAEEALKEAEKKYRTLVDNIPAVTYVAAIDETSTTLYVSPQIETILGVSPDTYKDDPDFWRKHLHPDDRERVLAEVTRSHNTNEPFISEYRMFSSDGSQVWLHDEARIVKDDEENPLYLQGVMTDITERKLAEDALRESEKQLRKTKGYLDNIIESSADAVVVVDMDEMVRSWNKAAEDYMGYTADEVIGTSNRKFFADPEEPERIMEMVLQDGELKNYRTTALTKDKKPVQISMSAALLKDSDGVPIGTVRISRDITKEVKLEERIEEERDNLNLIFDSMTDGVYSVSKDYEIEFMNKVLIDEFGDRVGSICYKAFHDREVPCPQCKNPEVMKGETVRWEWNSRKRNKTYDLIETPQKNIDGTISKLTLFRDITERKLAEEKLEKKIGELRRFNEMTVDRELKMVELKKKINVLLHELGKEPRYKILEEINTGTSE